jgi:hypothetical protein
MSVRGRSSLIEKVLKKEWGGRAGLGSREIEREMGGGGGRRPPVGI